MTQRRIWIAACLLVAVLGLPRTASAGLLEVIIEMSGPRMIGASAECRVTLHGDWTSCKFALGLVRTASRDARRPETWISLGSGVYTSVWKDANVHGYEFGDVTMVTFDPMFEVDFLPVPLVQVYHGAGLSFNHLFVLDSPDNSNFAFKLRPVGIAVPVSSRWSIDFSYDLRFYPDRFTPSDFGRTFGEVGTGPEWVQALVLGLRRAL